MKKTVKTDFRSKNKKKFVYLFIFLTLYLKAAFLAFVNGFKAR